MMIAIVSHFLESNDDGSTFECQENEFFVARTRMKVSNGSCIVAPRANDSIGRAIKSGVEHHGPQQQ
jgi:hypothetical protein